MSRDEMPGWSGNERFWQDTLPFEFDARRMGQAVAEVADLVRLVDLKSRARILDQACGTGRHTLELARRGYNVTGIDLTTKYLEIARANATASGLDINYLQSDMRYYAKNDAYDLAINMFTSFGYFEQENENVNVARNAFASLLTGGHYVIDTVNGPHVAQTPVVADQRRVQGALLDETSFVDSTGQSLRGYWVVRQPHKTKQTYAFYLRLYSGEQLTKLLLGCGFASVRLFGGLGGQPVRHDSPRIVAVATKQ